MSSFTVIAGKLTEVPAGCLCHSLKEVFGDEAPRCSHCTIEAKREELLADGFVEIELRFMQAFRDCGVEVRTIAAARTAWAPCWAEQLRDLFYGTHDLAPILGRCSVDAELVDALITTKVLAERQAQVSPPYEGGTREGYVVQKVRALAIELGVPLAPLST